MKEYNTENIRNAVFLGHSGSGKSTLAEAMLYNAGIIERMGKTEEGNLASDYDPEEAKRQMSINSVLLPIDTKTVKYNILDCPGSRDFLGEVKSTTHAADAALIFVDAGAGVEVGTEFAWEYADEYDLPTAFFVNKLDKENTDFSAVCQAISDHFGKNAVPFTLPIGKESGFSGVVDLLRMKAIEEKDGKGKAVDIPEDMKADAESMREQIIEAAAEGDDALMEKYFEEGTLSDEEIARGLKAAFIEKRFLPVLCGAAVQGIGVQALLYFFEHIFPNPLESPGLTVIENEEYKTKEVNSEGPLAAFVFKTVSDDFAGRLTFFKVVTGEFSPEGQIYNHTKEANEKVAHVMIPRGKKQEEVARVHAGDIGVVAKLSNTETNDTLGDQKNPVQFAPTIFPQQSTTVAIKAKSHTDEDKIGMGLHSLMEQDPTLKLERDPELRQTLLSGMGDQHLDVAVSRLRRRSKVEVDLVEPKVRYRETITKQAEGAYRHKKQSGGRGQFAEVHLRLAPLTDGEEFEFKWSIFGGAIPTNFQSAVEKGVRQAMEKGILAGYRAVGIGADCFDGKHHPVDSSDMAFQIAASQAFRQVAMKSAPIILEPIANVVTTVPESYMGDVMGDISQRRGKIQGSDPEGNKVVVRAQVPESEMLNYAQNLRSMTGGRGVYEKAFSHYEAVPREIQNQIVEKAQKDAEEEG